MLCDPDSPVQVSAHFSAQIITFDIRIPLTIGVPVLFHRQSTVVPGHISKLISTISNSTGKVIKNNPRSLSRNTTATVEITLQRPCCKC